MAASSAPILRAISRAFSGDMPGIMACLRPGALRSATFKGIPPPDGIIEPITIILENMSLEPSIVASVFLALSSNSCVKPLIRHKSASVHSLPLFISEVISDFASVRCFLRLPPFSLCRLNARGSTVIAVTVDRICSGEYGIPITYDAPVIFSLASSSAKFSILAISSAE